MTRTVLMPGTRLRFPDGSEYQIERLLGLGGSALTYEAKDLHSALYVALKELYPAEGFLRRAGQVVPEGDTSGGWAALNARKEHMREREAELSQRASRRSFQVIPILAPIYDTADITLPDGTLLSSVANCYARMDSLREKGMTVRDFVEAYTALHGALPLSVMADIMATVLDAYAALHSDGYLHGDCQTGNIFLLGADAGAKRVGVAHIIDFGSARELVDGKQTAPVLDDIYSTDGYCAPELLRREPGRTMTPACDVWALGVVFLNLLTGAIDRWLADGMDGLTEYLMLHPREKSLRPRMGKKLRCSTAVLALVNHILERSLDNEAANRYPDAAAMAADLRALARCLSFRWQEGADRWLLWEAALRYRDKNPALFRTEHIPQLVESLPVKKLELLASLDGGKPYPVQDILRDLPEGKDRCYRQAPDLFEENEELAELYQEMMNASTWLGEEIERREERLEELDTSLQHGRFLQSKMEEMTRQELSDDNFKIFAGDLFQGWKLEESRQEPSTEKGLLEDIEKWERRLKNLSDAHAAENTAPLRRPKQPEPRNWHGQGNLYLHAPGGAGKSYTVAEVLTGYLDSGEKLPLYLDMVRFTAEEQSGIPAPERVIFRLLSRQYFGGDEAIDDIANTLCKQSGIPGVCLVLDNLHKVEKSLRPRAAAAVRALHEKGGNTWLITVGRSADPFEGEGEKFSLPHLLELKPVKQKSVQELVQQIWKDKEVPEELGKFRDFQKHRQEKMFPTDRKVLEAQYSTLGLPLFLMRYLEVFSSMPTAYELPKGSAELLCRYFAQREYDANGREVHEFLTRHMPWVAYRYKTLGKAECAREEIEGWLKESYGRLRYRPEYLEAFLYQAVENLAVLTPGGEGLRFVHDCYQEYFSAAAISETLKQVVETGDIRLCEKINHTWDEEPEATWLILCTMDVVDGRVQTLCTAEEFEKELFAVLSANLMTAEQYAKYIPGCMLRGRCSFISPWSKQLEWLNPDKAFSIDDPKMNMKPYELVERLEEEIPWMELGALLGDPELQYYYGRYLWLRWGKAPDRDKWQATAVSWISDAAAQGHADACYLLSLHWRHGFGVSADEEMALNWTVAAAERGHAKAAVWAGIYLEEGIGAPKDMEAAVRFYEMAAEAGHAEGQFRYGWACWEGEGREKSDRQALYWFSKAAAQKHPEGCYWLGYMYDHGDGVAEDKRLALNYYRQAAREGHPEAQYQTGLAYRKGEAVKESKTMAATWFERAAKQGHTKAMNALADLLIDGEADYKKELFLEREPMEEALCWLQRSHEDGDLTGTNNLGWMYRHGHGMAAPDYAKALELFRQAAEQGRAASMNHLGEMYELGQGVEPDLGRALEYFRQAAEKGSAKGRKNYERLTAK